MYNSVRRLIFELLEILILSNADVKGPEGTVYATGIFKVEIQIPERYDFLL